MKTYIFLLICIQFVSTYTMEATRDRGKFFQRYTNTNMKKNLLSLPKFDIKTR